MSLQLVPVYSGTILVHFVSFRCYSASFRHIPVYSVPFLCLVTPVLLVYSALFCCHSASFWYIAVPFLLIPSHSNVIRFYSRVIPPCSGIFRFIPVYAALFVCHSASFRCHSSVISVYSGTILVHSISFRCHSASFRHIPVYSSIFRSVPFRSVPFLCLVVPQCTNIVSLIVGSDLG